MNELNHILQYDFISSCTYQLLLILSFEPGIKFLASGTRIYLVNPMQPFRYIENGGLMVLES